MATEKVSLMTCICVYATIISLKIWELTGMRLSRGVEAMPSVITEAGKVRREGGLPRVMAQDGSQQTSTRGGSRRSRTWDTGGLLLLGRGLTCSLVGNTPEPSSSFSV